MGHWYAAVTTDGKETILGVERTLRELGEALGFSSHAIGYYYREGVVCRKLCAKVIRIEE